MNSQNQKTVKDESIDFKEILFKIKSYWFPILLSLIFCIILAAIYIRYYTRPMYSVSSKIEIRDDSDDMMGTENIFEGMEMFSVKTNLKNEQAILKTHSLAEKTLKKLNLNISYYKYGTIKKVNQYKISPFKVIYDTLHPQIAGVELFINIIDSNSFNLSFECSDQSVYYIYNNKKNKKIKANYSYNKIHTFNEIIESPHYSFYIKKTDFFDKTSNNDIEYFFKYHTYNELKENRITINKINKEIDSLVKSILDNNSKKSLNTALINKQIVDSLHNVYNDELTKNWKVIKDKHKEWKQKQKDKLLNELIDSDFSFKLHDIDLLTRKYVKDLNVSPLNDESSILKLNIIGFTARKNIDYINTLSNIYIKDGLSEKNKMASNTIKFIDQQIKRTKDSSIIISNNLQSFKSNNPTISVSEKDYGIYFQKGKQETRISEYKINLDYYQQLLSYLKNSEGSENIISPTSMKINNPELNNLISTFITLNAEKKELELYTKENHPKYQSIISKINYTRNSIIENLKNVISTTKNALINEEKIINNFNKDIKDLPAAEKEYVQIIREKELIQNLENYLIEKRQSTAIAKEGTEPDHKIIDIARQDSRHPVSPNKILIYLLSSFFGLIIPVSIISLIEFLNEKIRSKSDITKITNIPILGVVGHSETLNHLSVLNNPKSIIAESFRSIRTNIQYLSTEKTCKVITITSSVGSEGKTFCSTNLASILSIAGYKTLIIGADLRKPMIHKSFELSNKNGLSSFLIGKNKQTKIIKKINENLSLIPSGPIPPNPSELLNSEKMANFIEDLKKKYDYILIDTPPIGIVTDGVIAMKFSDINLYIVRHNYTKKKMLNALNEIDDKQKIRNVNIIINDFHASKGTYSYGYGYGYEYNNGDGYYEQKNK